MLKRRSKTPVYTTVDGTGHAKSHTAIKMGGGAGACNKVILALNPS